MEYAVDDEDDALKFYPSASSFIVAVDDVKRFKKGDILMAASWNAPARNRARGNVIDGGYGINWTGAEYL